MISIELVVGFALRDRTVLDYLGPGLRNDLVLGNVWYRELVEFADDFASKRNRLPLEGDWDLWLAQLPPERREGSREALARVLGTSLSGYTPDYFGEEVIKTLQETAAKNAVHRLNSLQDVTPELLRTITEQVQDVQANDLQNLAHLRDTSIWLRPETREELIPSGFSNLDRRIGGWGQELVILFAGSGVGKSMALQNYGAGSARLGRRVVHITLELGLRALIQRYYLQIAYRTKEQLRQAEEEVRKRVEHWLQFAQGDVHLLEFPAYSVTVDDLKRAVDRIARMYGDVDLIIVDYLDLLIIPKGERSYGRYEDLGKITHQLRGLCPTFGVPTLTASQAVRKPQHADTLTLMDMGDSYDKVRGAGILLALNQTVEEEENYQGRLGLLKVREAAGGNFQIPLYINREMALIAELDNPNTRRVMEERGHIPMAFPRRRPGEESGVVS